MVHKPDSWWQVQLMQWPFSGISLHWHFLQCSFFPHFELNFMDESPIPGSYSYSRLSGSIHSLMSLNFSVLENVLLTVASSLSWFCLLPSLLLKSIIDSILVFWNSCKNWTKISYQDLSKLYTPDYCFSGTNQNLTKTRRQVLNCSSEHPLQAGESEQPPAADLILSAHK